MAYNLTDVKSIKVISNPDTENPVSMTLNKNFKINPSATFSKVDTALKRIYRLSDLDADQIILNSEFNILKPAIDYEIISGADCYARFDTVGLIDHTVELNTTENILSTYFQIPTEVYFNSVAYSYFSGKKGIAIKIAVYKTTSNISTKTGTLKLVTPSKEISLYVNMHINQNEP